VGNYKLISPPSGLVITVSDVKKHLNLADAETFWDGYLATLIGIAQDMVQNQTWISLLSQQWFFTLDTDEVGDIVKLSKCPIISIDTVKYINGDGDLTTVDISDYITDLTSQPARIKFTDMPQIKADTMNALQIEFTAGFSYVYSVAVTVDSINLSTNVLTEAAHGLKNSDVIEFNSIGTITGIATDTPYYIISRTTNTFKISATINGTEIDLTGSTSTMPTYRVKSVENVPESIKQAIKLIVGDYFMHREDSEYAKSTTIPNSADSLLLPYSLKDMV
jgi:uncharacterized phiE125 gp8 family phage protein